MSASKPSFVKRGASRLPSIAGTRASVHNTHLLLAATGVPDLDDLLGGGVPIGSVVVIRDESPSKRSNELSEPPPQFSRVLLKCFLSEGVANGHGILFGACEHDAKGFLGALPEIVEQQHGKQDHPQKRDSDSDQLTIAWRYKASASQLPAASASTPRHHFNLQKNIAPDRLASCDAQVWTPSGRGVDSKNEYLNYFRVIKERLKTNESYSVLPLKPGEKADAAAKKNLLRIGVGNAGSLLWADDDDGSNFVELTRFLLALRSICRSHLATCFVLLDDLPDLSPAAERRIFEAADFGLCLEPFSTADRTGMFKDHHGFFRVVKAAALNSLQQRVPTGGKMLFKSARTKFSIEKIHLPPELGDESVTDAKKASDKSTTKSGIDF